MNSPTRLNDPSTDLSSFASRRAAEPRRCAGTTQTRGFGCFAGMAMLLLALLTQLGCSNAEGDKVVATAGREAATSETANVAPTAAESLRFLHRYQDGMAQARQTGKPMLLFFTAEWCTFCHEMEREAFRHTDVVRLAREFVCVAVDADTQAEVCKDFGVQMFPTVQFVSSEGVALNRVIGGSSAEQLVPQMEAALRAVVARRDLPTSSFLR